jgi:hypothetical protein
MSAPAGVVDTGNLKSLPAGATPVWATTAFFRSSLAKADEAIEKVAFPSRQQVRACVHGSGVLVFEIIGLREGHLGGRKVDDLQADFHAVKGRQRIGTKGIESTLLHGVLQDGAGDHVVRAQELGQLRGFGAVADEPAGAEFLFLEDRLEFVPSHDADPGQPDEVGIQNIVRDLTNAGKLFSGYVVELDHGNRDFLGFRRLGFLHRMGRASRRDCGEAQDQTPPENEGFHLALSTTRSPRTGMVPSISLQ